MSSDGNFLSFLFGNVGEDGKLENEELDDELKATLTASTSILNKFMQSSILGDDVGAASSSKGSSSKMAEGKIQPAADAVDYADMAEEVEDNSMAIDEVAPPPVLVAEPLVEIKKPIPLTAKPAQSVISTYTQKLLKDMSEDTVVKFTQLVFAPGQYDKPVARTRATIRKEAYVASSVNRIKLSGATNDEQTLFNSEVLLEELFGKDRDEEFAYHSLLKIAHETRMQERRERQDVLGEGEGLSPAEEELSPITDDGVGGSSSQLISTVPESYFHPVTLLNWESEIMWDDTPKEEPVDVIKRDFSIPDYELLIGDWTENIQWGDSEVVAKKIPVEIPLNDPNLIIDIIYPETQTQLEARKLLKPLVKRNLLTSGYSDPNQNIPHPFNLSNDRYYDVHKLHHKHGKLQRANLSKSYIEHSLPALQLKMPFFKRYMSKGDMRSFHRPPLKMNPGEVMDFARVKQLKNRKKMYKGQSMADILQSVEDITLKDNSHFVLFEYSEEYPPLLSNTGMGSLIVNYYRKKEEKDPTIPKLPLGVPHVLENVDASPFFMFGQISPGETVQAIKNNLYIAPIFQHQLRNEDFLLIRFTPKFKKKRNVMIPQKPICYVREPPKVFTVGQTFPLTIVHPPQSRKMKLFIRDRLKVLALQRIKKRGRQSKYPVHHIVNSFHRYHDQSIRKHLRDFAEVIRGPNNTQYLKVHASVPVPSEQELHKMCTPEMVCCFESLRVGQQRLADIGYGTQSLNVGDEDSTDGGDDDAQMDDEIQLASWNVTRNFLLAAQQKGMVQIYGPGDPTGRGEGFSMFRFSMKEMFVRAGASRDEIEAYFQSQTKTGHRFSITDQQKMYQEELNRVWDAQKLALVNDADLELDQDEIRERNGYQNEMGMDAEEEKEWREVMRIYGDDGKGMGESSNPPSGAPSPHPTKLEMDSQSIHSFSSRNVAVKKALLIKRLINGQWSEEVVTDPRVIQPYMKQKRLMELSGGGKNAINIEDDEETIKKKIKEELRRLKRESGISKAELIQRAQKARNEEDGDRLGSSQRKCRSCGQIGHIMTNRICPNFATNYPDKAKQDAASNIKIQDGKMIIPTVALQVVEEKMIKEKLKADRLREKNNPGSGNGSSDSLAQKSNGQTPTMAANTISAPATPNIAPLVPAVSQTPADSTLEASQQMEPSTILGVKRIRDEDEPTNQN